MPVSGGARPAHRPSRRHQLIEGAVELFAVKPPDLVTIAELVRHAGMTPAAFYYHFSSRDELFLEVLDRFGRQWADNAEQWWGAASSAQEVLDAAARLLDWALDQRREATVFFVTSKGASVAAEELRRRVGNRAAAAAGEAVRRARPDCGPARAALDGVSLLTLLESALHAELSLEASFRTLGPQHFREEVLGLCRRVLDVRALAP
jgi:AcrR family transcriptional regulator